MGELNVTHASSFAARGRGRAGGASLRNYLALGKLRLSALVLATTLVGYLLPMSADVDWIHLGATLAGTALAAFGANALNQCLEADHDARMRRTRRRPLPARRLPTRSALLCALSTSLCGPLVLATFANTLSACLAAAAVLIYVLAYTPLKTRTPLCMLVGAVVGAIPPMIGWAAAAEQLELGAWVLAGILFLWQIPHALALAWLYREDYKRGGFCMLPSVDSSGRLTVHAIVVYSLMLLPLGLTMALIGVSGPTYAIGSLLLGVGLLGLVLRLRRSRTDAGARRVFVATITYLPLLLALMVFDRAPTDRQPPGPVRHATHAAPALELANLPSIATPQTWEP